MAQEEMPLKCRTAAVSSGRPCRVVSSGRPCRERGQGQGQAVGQSWGSLIGRNRGFHQGASDGKVRKRKGKPAEDNVMGGKA